jgi:alpha-beta hydrolase superfamily lysophospholipase
MTTTETLPHASSFVSVQPVRLPARERGADLLVRVTAPSEGEGLPVVVFSHGYAELMEGYAPLAHAWAAAGFVVIQPAHLDSRPFALPPTDPRTPDLWRHRIADLREVIDELDTVERAVPGMAGRFDHRRVAVAGHSWGATTASALLGARVVGADGEVGEDMTDSRVSAGVLLAVAGTGGDNLTPFAAEHFAFMNPDFSAMNTPALLVAGEKDQSPLSGRGPEWWTEAYTLSPAPKVLLTLADAEHTMGGVAGYSTHPITDWDIERVEMVQQITTAYLRRQLADDARVWTQVENAMKESAENRGALQST